MYNKSLEDLLKSLTPTETEDRFRVLLASFVVVPDLSVINLGLSSNASCVPLYSSGSEFCPVYLAVSEYVARKRLCEKT